MRERERERRVRKSEMLGRGREIGGIKSGRLRKRRVREQEKE